MRKDKLLTRDVPKQKIIFNNEKFQMAEYKDGTIWGKNLQFGKRLRKEGWIISHSKSALMDFSVDSDGKPLVVISVTADDLLAFAKEAKKREREFAKKQKDSQPTIFFQHLTPDVSFVLEIPKKKVGKAPKKG